jgi:predicted metal-dependent enzyme (double-stranded beta helix superfamily)
MSAGEFFVDHPILRRFVATTDTIIQEQIEVNDRLWHLRRPYAELLNDSTWLPDEFRQPNFNSAMGGGIASWLLYRSEAKDLSLFSLVVPVRAATPVHNHLAWGLVGLYQGEQEEEEFDVPEDHDHHHSESHQIPFKLRTRRILKQGEYYELIPPYNFIRSIHQSPLVSERYRLRRATEIRSREWTDRTIPLRLEQCSVSGRHYQVVLVGEALRLRKAAGRHCLAIGRLGS